MVQRNGMPYNEEGTLTAIQNLLKTVQTLRAPNGCPWDRDQTHQSLRPHLIEEAYEVLEVLDQVKTPADLLKPGIRQGFVEEWGDVLLQILLQAEIASEAHPSITFEQIAHELNEKLIRRHPHVFQRENPNAMKADTASEVKANWDQIKKTEKKHDADSKTQDSILGSVQKGLAPLPRTMKIIQKVTKVGFQWPDLQGPTEKLMEEVAELKEALSQNERGPREYLDHIEEELGDVLFSVCNIAYFLKLDPESALRGTLRKFESRFQYIESELLKRGKSPAESTLDEMDEIWRDAKRLEGHTP
jgi:tetrapyrrole methylase family protein/MazG family protein